MTVSEISKIITADGTEYDLTDGVSRWVTQTPSNMGLPQIEPVLGERIGVIRQAYQTFSLEAREIVIEIRYQGCDRDDYWQLRSELLNIIRPNRGGELTYIFTLFDGTKYAIKGIVTDFSLETPDVWDEWGFGDALGIFCADPIFFSPTLANDTIASVPDTELQFDITFDDDGIYFGDTSKYGIQSITYIGTWHTYPIVTITGPGNNPTVIHVEKGVYCQFLYPIASGEVVTLDFNTLSFQSSIIGDITNYLTFTSNVRDLSIDPDPIQAGGINTIQVNITDTDGNTEVDVSYQARYIGF